MNNLELIELRESEMKKTDGGFIIIGLFPGIFDAIDAAYAFLEGFDEGYSRTCKCK